jgi:hypothetical protein
VSLLSRLWRFFVAGSGKPSFGVLLDCREVEHHLPTPKAVRKKTTKVVPEPDQPF